MNLLRPALALLLLSLPAMADDGAPGDQVDAAVKKLAEAPGYAWRITMTAGGDSRFRPGPVEGRSVKGGCTRWVMSFGERRIEAFVKDGKVAVKTEEGWARPDDIKPPAPPPSPPAQGSATAASQPPPPRDREHRREGDDRRGGFRKDGKPGFLARRIESMKAPVEMAAELKSKVSSLKVDGDAITGNFTPEAAGELLAFGDRRPGRGPEPANPQGSVKFWVKDGRLQKMELTLSATVSINGNEVSMERTSTFEISDPGSTPLEVPAEAIKLLEKSSPPQPHEKKPD